MPVSNEQNFAYLDISRPITRIDDFLNTARYLGDAIFGSETTTVLTQPACLTDETEINFGDEEYEPILDIIPTGAPRLQIYNPDDLRLTLLHRRQPVELHGTSRLRYAAGKLVAHAAADTPSAGSLQDVLFRIGLEFDVPNQEAVPIRFSAVQANLDPEFDEKGFELALVPAPADSVTRMLIKQAKVCFAGLPKKTAYPSGGAQPLNVPFARLPWDISDEECEKFIGILDELLPIRGVMGAIPRTPTTHNS